MWIFLSVASGSQDILHKDKGQHSESNMEWSVRGKDFDGFVVPSPYFIMDISFLIVLFLIVYVKAFVDNSHGQKIKIGVFDEDKASDDESLGT